MGLFDDAVPGGNITKPLLIALGALLAGKVLSGRGKEDEALEAPAERQLPPGDASNDQVARQAPQDEAEGGGGLLGGGLGDLLEKLKNSGQGKAADSWVKPEAKNESIEPNDLGKAIGGKLLGELSRRTGVPEDQLLEQLSKVLPGVVDKLTPDGKVPTSDQVAGQLGKSPW